MIEIVLRLLLLCLLVSSVAQAAVPWRPPTESLPQDELIPQLAAWDSALVSRNFDDFEQVLGSTTAMIPKGERFSKAFFIRYNNPEIIDRVVRYFLVTDDGLKIGSPIFPESYAEGYFTYIAELAESTFDPRIYENRLVNENARIGRFWYVYLATVNPEKTLDYLFKSKTGDKSPRANARKGGHPEYLYHRGEAGWASILDAFRILSNIITQSPQVLRDDSDRVVNFIAEHVKSYWKLRTQRDYLGGHDYYVRYDALDLLEFLGTVTEVPLIEEIIRDAPIVNLNEMRGGFGRMLSQYEQIQDKGQRVIGILRQRSPSQN